MSRLLCIALVLWGLPGCAAIHPPPIERSGLDELNRVLSTYERLEIELSDGRRVDAVRAVLSPTTARLTMRATGADLLVPTAIVVSMVYIRRSGTRTGMLVGMAPGAGLAVGGLVHVATTDGYGVLAGLGVMGVGVMTGALGAGLGAFVGHRVRPAKRLEVYRGPIERYIEPTTAADFGLRGNLGGPVP